MTKKFTKGCAVDVRGWDELPYGEVMLETIKRVLPYDHKSSAIGFDSIKLWQFLIVVDDKLTLGDYTFNHLEMITPTDILGEHLVKAIEEGYTPWLEGDEIPSQSVDYVTIQGSYFRAINPSSLLWEASGIIAYKPIEQPSIESKTLSEKVGPSMFDMSVKDFEIAKSCKQNLELILAKEENKPYIEGLVRELGL